MMSIIFVIMSTEKNKDIIPDEFLFWIGIITLPIALLSFRIVLQFVPYRGTNLMIIRKKKLKMIIRKTRINKLKFWK